MDNSIEIKDLELKISDLEDELGHLKSDIKEKESLLQELQSRLKYLQISEKTNNVSIGDSLFFMDEDDLEIETMLISDSRGYLDLVFLTDCSHICESMARGVKMNKKYMYIDSLIKDVETNEGLKFVGYNE